MRHLLTTSSFGLALLLFVACGKGSPSDGDTSSGGAEGSGASGGADGSGATSSGGADGSGASSSGGEGGSGASSSDGGSGADGGGSGDGGSGTTLSTHYLGGIGPDDLACTCLDGSVVKSCAVIDCEEEADVTAQCATDCEDHGGVDSATCTDNGAACVGTAKLLCFCEDDSIVEICQTIDCFEGNDQEEICDPACETRGGSKAISCLAGDQGCVGGPDLVECSCEGGSTKLACGASTCGDEPNLDSVCASACLQAGDVTASVCTDDHDACQ